MKNVGLRQWLLGVSCLLVVVGLVSCSKDNGDESNLSNNSKLTGTKWTLINWDYSLGDDYIGLHDETYRFFFYSSTEGAFYYGRKDSYSDQGDSKQRVACHFKYTLSGNTVILDYITDRIISNAVLILDENILRSGDLEFSKETISSSDYSWLNSVHGSTGSCFWYSDMCGKLWIVGDGTMANYSSYEATPWAKSSRTPNCVIVDEGVKTIGSYAFADVSITSVELPEESLTRISDYAFKGSLIKEVWIGDNTTHIGTEAFANCTKLKDINIPKSLKEVGNYAFSGCTAVNEFKIEFGEELRTIGEYAFEGGEASYLIFNEGLQSISTGAFIGDYCGISKELVLPNSLETIGATAFEGAYKKIVLGTGVESIGEKAFISGATSGVMYVNLSTPPAAGTNIIAERSKWSPAESRWTLYVPKGCKSAYSNKSPWNKFKSIIEDSNLEGGNNDSKNEDEDVDKNIVKVDYDNLFYIADGNTYKMILVDGGTLQPFYMMQTEVPVAGYIQIGDTYIGTIDTNADQCIIKSELRNFIAKLNDATGLEFRLPTEAEWMFAAKGGVKSRNYIYSGSDNIDDVAWYNGNCDEVQGIALKQPNELGFYDMSGNYAEVCSDDPVNIDGRAYGGCWKYTASDCTLTSWKSGNTSASKIPGTKIKENNAIDGRYITVRLVYSIPE